MSRQACESWRCDYIKLRTSAICSDAMPSKTLVACNSRTRNWPSGPWASVGSIHRGTQPLVGCGLILLQYIIARHRKSPPSCLPLTPELSPLFQRPFVSFTLSWLRTSPPHIPEIDTAVSAPTALLPAVFSPVEKIGAYH